MEFAKAKFQIKNSLSHAKSLLDRFRGVSHRIMIRAPQNVYVLAVLDLCQRFFEALISVLKIIADVLVFVHGLHGRHGR